MPEAKQTSASDTPVVTIACDESGAEGENLISASHPVFVHSSVALDLESATEVMTEVRRRIPSQAPEFKAAQLIRPQNRQTLFWLLAKDGPLHEKALTFLCEKRYFITGKVIDLLVEEAMFAAGIDLYANDRARQMAFLLYREGSRAFGAQRWNEFLEVFNRLARAKNRKGAEVSVDDLFRLIDEFRLRSRRRSVGELMSLLWRTRPQAEELVDKVLDIPALDPLFPALSSAIQSWGENRHPVHVLHDEQAAFRPERIERLREVLLDPPESMTKYMPRQRLHALDLIDSNSDSRIQVADLIAGAARKIATDELAGQGDEECNLLLRPFIHPYSLWGDDRSWSRLTGA